MWTGRNFLLLFCAKTLVSIAMTDDFCYFCEYDD